MARAHSIYILTGEVTGLVIGTFTVKHEMESARRRFPGKPRCTRYPDNHLGAPGVSCDDAPTEDRSRELMCDVSFPEAGGAARP
jgi:hypothetical protein